MPAMAVFGHVFSLNLLERYMWYGSLYNPQIVNIVEGKSVSLTTIEMDRIELIAQVEKQAKQLTQLKKKLLITEQAKASLEADYQHVIEMLQPALG